MSVTKAARISATIALLGVTLGTAASCGSSASDKPLGPGVQGKPDGSHYIVAEAGTGSDCKSKTCDELGYTCGPNADGCGNLIQCGSCTGSDYCGGGGYSKCGNPSLAADGAPLVTCIPKTCSDFPAKTCGQQSDGCGALTPSCSTCTGTDFCGGGGPSLCGTPLPGTDGGSTCVARTCTDFPAGTCGQQGDGCGALTADCTPCVNPAFCGGDPAKPGTCGGDNGKGADGAVVSTPCIVRTCNDFPTGTCGQQGDGCGGFTLNCTTCTGNQFCGGGGPSRCGTGLPDAGSSGQDGGNQGACTNKKTCTNYPGTCGQQSDGCGGLTANCSTCTNPQYCGGGGPGKCGGNNGLLVDGSTAPTCQPATCASLNYNCGYAGDGCGGTIGPCDLGAGCPSGLKCGAGAQPNVCGTNIACTGLCQQQVNCGPGVTTTLTGVVRAGLQESTQGGNPFYWVPQGTTPDPVPGALVFIPTTALKPFDTDPSKPQVKCTTCSDDVSGDPLVFTTTDYAGRFTLQNVPVSLSALDKIPVVIQLGHWRRKYDFAITQSCTQNVLPQDLNLPSKSTEGDIPLTAISTGSRDPIECVLLKMGISQQEFMSYSTWQAEPVVGTQPRLGRVHIYTSGGSGTPSPGSQLAPIQSETVLFGTGTTGGPTNGTFMLYDQIILPCWGNEATKNAAELSNLGYYGDHGGHFFATHYSYSWMNSNANSNLSSVANWNPKANTNTGNTAFTGDVSSAVPTINPGVFVNWLNEVSALNGSNPGGAPPANPTVTINEGRHDVDGVANKSIGWITGTDPLTTVNPRTMALHFTFDMPVPTVAVPAPTQCGHGIFSDFHVQISGGGSTNGTTFPAECNTNAMTAQEKILEYMIWDLASCAGNPPSPTCTSKTCNDIPAGICGPQSDGCGNLLPDCHPCQAGETCGGGGTPNVCAPPVSGGCTPLDCSTYPTGTCGQQSNGCGDLTVSCPCPVGQTCGGAGVAGQCGTPPTPTCVPKTCTDYPAGTCGQQSDGCGNLTPDCSPCATGQTCGGCGVAGQCCTPPSSGCVPQACPPSVQCGPAGDGCGGVIPSCGTCTPPQTCGGAGVAGQCGGTAICGPLTCQDQNITCGPAGDGCGNLIASCGTCTPPQTCGGGGVAGQCGGGSACVPKTCQELGVNCGPAGDGCGDLIPSCGTCVAPETCGGGGIAGKCGSPVIH